MYTSNVYIRKFLQQIFCDYATRGVRLVKSVKRFTIHISIFITE